MPTKFFVDPEPVLGTVVRLFASYGAAREVAILTYSSAEIVETGFDSWNGGVTYYNLFLHLPINLYTQVEPSIDEISKAIFDKIQVVLKNNDHESLNEVVLTPAVVDDPQWREKASSWLNGSKVTNQGRVRSDNVAPLTQDGLLFRSPPEIHVYKALKACGVSFAPLPVFIRGGDSYSRIEPDFVIVYKGILMVLEVDGDTVHTETPSEAQARTRTLQYEGVYVERISASECNTPQKAQEIITKIIESFKKIKESK